eukprot:2066263-Rhodomonas_salina.1
MSYAMSSTDIRYAAMALRTCYAIAGTDVGYGGTRSWRRRGSSKRRRRRRSEGERERQGEREREREREREKPRREVEENERKDTQEEEEEEEEKRGKSTEGGKGGCEFSFGDGEKAHGHGGGKAVCGWVGVLSPETVCLAAQSCRHRDSERLSEGERLADTRTRCTHTHCRHATAASSQPDRPETRSAEGAGADMQLGSGSPRP